MYDFRADRLAAAKPFARFWAMRTFMPSFIAALALAACVETPSSAPAGRGASFDALTFFSGRTIGTGRLKKIMSASEQTTVHGSGHVEGDTLILDQAIKEGNKPLRQRRWRIHRDSDGDYSGSLSDAVGPITGHDEGNQLHLAFTMKGGFATEQWLTLAADGRSAHNKMVVKKLGIRVAVLDEEIQKTD
jgi:hypothetical protein